MLSLAKVRGYIKSVGDLRRTRITVDKLLDQSSGSMPANQRGSAATVQRDAFLDAHAITEIGARQFKSPFRPNEIFPQAREMRRVLTNGLAIDFDGGVNENLKSVLRTPFMSQRHVEDSDLNLVTVMRPEQESFWKCIIRSYQLHVPLYFVETAFFGGYGSYFDKTLPPAFRKSLGFIFDDMGYYFDCRQPSRLETLLNDAELSLTSGQRELAVGLISNVCQERITKYNRYVKTQRSTSYIEDGIVLVVDQKRNDASIRFGGASNGTFDQVLQAAVEENDGHRVYVKPHPDNKFETGGDAYKGNKGWSYVDDDISIFEAVEKADVVYTVSSQVGFEALLRGKRVVVFGLPFYAGWGLTDDRKIIPRRRASRSVEDLFYRACVEMSVYIDPDKGRVTDLSNTIDRLVWMRSTESRR